MTERFLFQADYFFPLNMCQIYLKEDVSEVFQLGVDNKV